MSLQGKKTNAPVAGKVTSLGAKNLTFNPNSYTSESVSLEKVLEVHEAFNLFDTDGQGSIDIKGNAFHMQS